MDMSKWMVAIINGYPRAGKDTAVELAIRSLSSGLYRGNMSSVDYLKKTLKSWGLPVDTKTAQMRNCLSAVKQALEDNGNWASKITVSKVIEHLEQASKSFSHGILFLHIREPESITCVKACLHQLDVRVRTLFIEREVDAALLTNDSERGVENYAYDMWVQNTGSINDLKEQMVIVARQLQNDLMNPEPEMEA